MVGKKLAIHGSCNKNNTPFPIVRAQMFRKVFYKSAYRFELLKQLARHKGNVVYYKSQKVHALLQFCMHFFKEFL